MTEAAMTDTAPVHLLLVDDEAISALALERFLKRRGFRVSLAHDGLRALELAEVDPPALLVTDMRMPRLGGADLVRRLRTARPDLPVVVVTGYMSSDPEAEGLSGPATTVMTKPLDPEALLRSVRGLLGIG